MEGITLRKLIELGGRLPEYVLTIVIQDEQVVKCELQELQDALALQHLLTRPPTIENIENQEVSQS